MLTEARLHTTAIPSQPL